VSLVVQEQQLILTADLTFVNLMWLVGWFMVFNATFNTSSIKSRRTVLLMEETGVPGENHRLVTSH